MTELSGSSHFPPVAPIGEDVVLVDREAAYDGNLTFEGTGRIEGRVTGQVFSEGTLVIGSQARVEATLDVGHLVVHGELQGDVTAKRAIDLCAGARVRADLRTPSLLIERGVLFDGRCEMTAAQPAPLTVPEALDSGNDDVSAPLDITETPPPREAEDGS